LRSCATFNQSANEKPYSRQEGGGEGNAADAQTQTRVRRGRAQSYQKNAWTSWSVQPKARYKRDLKQRERCPVDRAYGTEKNVVVSGGSAVSQIHDCGFLKRRMN
jgi:hypothetical protein